MKDLGVMPMAHKKIKANEIIQFFPLIGLVVLVGLAIFGIKSGVFSSVASLQKFISGLGGWAVIVFVLIQIGQVIVPILPGGISCVVGLLLFGNIKGLILNFIGIIIGEILGFLLVRKYGENFIHLLLSDKNYTKYQTIMSKFDNHVEKFLILMIMIPFAPDDVACLFSGLSKLTFATYCKVLLIFKPFSITFYSFFMLYIFDKVQKVI